MCTKCRPRARPRATGAPPCARRDGAVACSAGPAADAQTLPPPAPRAPRGRGADAAALRLPLPPRSAEDWDVNKWLAEVTCKLFTRSDDSAVVRLLLLEGGDLFAECPLPKAGPVASVRRPLRARRGTRAAAGYRPRHCH
jgi:hypothetical protein